MRCRISTRMSSALMPNTASSRSIDPDFLALAGGAVRAVRDRDAVSGAPAAEIPSFHGAGKALADRDARDIDLLADDEMVGGNFRADRKQIVRADAEFAQHGFHRHLRFRE